MRTGVRPLVQPALVLTAGFEQHPLADRLDQAGLLGQRNETIRRHQPQSRVLPPHQGFDADNPVAQQIHLRLVMQNKLPPLQRRTQLAFQLPAVAHADIHRFGEHLPPAAPVLARNMHGRRRLLHQAFQALRRRAKTANADADRDVEALVADSERLFQLGNQSAGDSAAASALQSVRSNANSSLPRRASKSAEPTKWRSRSPIARNAPSPAVWPRASLTLLKLSMSMHSRQTRSGCAGCVEPALALFQKQRTVGQPGQRILAGQMPQAAFRRQPGDLKLARRLSLCRHVAENSVHDLPAAHMHGVQDHVERQRPAVRVQELPVKTFAARLEDLAASLRQRPVPMAGRPPGPAAPARAGAARGCFARIDAEQAQRRIVAVEQPVGIEKHHGIAGALPDGLEFRVAQPLHALAHAPSWSEPVRAVRQLPGQGGTLATGRRRPRPGHRMPAREATRRSRVIYASPGTGEPGPEADIMHLSRRAIAVAAVAGLARRRIPRRASSGRA